MKTFAPTPRRALVLSGGGATGAYGVGAAGALLQGKVHALGGQPLGAEIYAGTSSGAFNATFLAAGADRPPAACYTDLASLWRDRLATSPSQPGAYRLRMTGGGGGLGSMARWAGDGLAVGLGLLRHGRETLRDSGTPFLDLLDAGAFFEADGWQQAIGDCIDFSRLDGNGCRLRITATDWMTGDLRVFDESAVARFGAEAVLASSAVPGLLAPVALDGRLYVDGSIRANAPLLPAIHAGADEIHVVSLATDVADRPPARGDGTLRAFYRSLAIGWSAAVARDIARVAAFNRALAALDAEPRMPSACRDGLLAAFDALAGWPNGTPRRRPLTVHRYVPSNGFTDAEGFFDLDRDRIASAIEQGFAETANHDCTAAGCVGPVPDAHGREVAHG